MLKIHASINKKVPIPGHDYSSQSFGAGIEVELADGTTNEQLQTKIAEVYFSLHEAIDAQINGVTAFGTKPEDFKQTKPPAQQQKPSTPTSGNNGNKNGCAASDKQIGLIINLAKDVNVSRQELDSACHRIFNTDVDHLSKMDASSMIGNLQKIRDGKINVASIFGTKTAKAA